MVAEVMNFKETQILNRLRNVVCVCVCVCACKEIETILEELDFLVQFVYILSCLFKLFWCPQIDSISIRLNFY